jgi:NAD(P)-dependent dehydrogenase (short-subunit alcohol dehydrogenase family)
MNPDPPVTKAVSAIGNDVSLARVKSVLITGASTGIGRAGALRMDADGWRVFASVRREEDAEDLRQAASGRLVPLILDVTDAGQLAAAAERIGAEVGAAGLDGLVNNAGIAVMAPLETIELDDLRHQLEVNLISQVAVTQALLPQIRTARGRIVFISSIGGRMAMPFGAPYHASKYGIEAVADCLRQELRPWRIDVVGGGPRARGPPRRGRGGADPSAPPPPPPPRRSGSAARNAPTPRPSAPRPPRRSSTASRSRAFAAPSVARPSAGFHPRRSQTRCSTR